MILKWKIESTRGFNGDGGEDGKENMGEGQPKLKLYTSVISNPGLYVNALRKLAALCAPLKIK